MRRSRRPLFAWLVAASFLIAFVANTRAHWIQSPVSFPSVLSELADDEVRLIENPRTAADKIVNGAKKEAIAGVTYDATYVFLHYPNGDVKPDRGACTDVVVRALRNAGHDLQRLIHEDKQRSPSSYPRYQGPRLDRNIDHRRVPNQMAFLRRHGKSLTLRVTQNTVSDWKPGDIVYWKIPMDHCGIISNDRNADGIPLVVHNCGRARQEDCLTAWEIVGHFRYPR